jgi:Tfp pilus assembly protein PilV
MKKHFLKTYSNQQGLGLVETIIALGVGVMVITSIVSLSVFTLRSSTQSRLMLQATKVASEELELVRAKRDTANAWPSFRSSFYNPPGIDCSVNDCYIDSNTLVVAQGTELISETGGASMVRSFRVSNPTAPATTWLNTNTLRFSVTVNWSVGGVTKSTHTYTDLTNWRGL